MTRDQDMENRRLCACAFEELNAFGSPVIGVTGYISRVVISNFARDLVEFVLDGGPTATAINRILNLIANKHYHWQFQHSKKAKTN
jgi:hypothetical protein